MKNVNILQYCPMKKYYIINLLLCISGFFIINNYYASSKSNTEILTIGTYNAEWLGDGIKDRNKRTDDELAKIANILTTLDADVIGIQEVENDIAMNKLVSKMPGYKYYLCQLDKKSKQRLGIIYKSTLNIKNFKSYPQLLVPHYGKSLRPGLICYIEKNGTAFLCMFVHLKSTSRYDNTPEKLNLSREIRTEQNQILSDFVDSVNKVSPKTRIILLGDFNDTPKRKKHNTMAALISNPNINFLTTEQKSCKYPTTYTIDHIVVNNLAKEKYITGSLFQLNIFNMFNKEEVKKISDHCPILVKFDVSKKKK